MPGNPNMNNSNLRTVFESLRFNNVKTVISSGNVIFDSSIGSSADLGASIEKAIFEQIGFHSTTIVLSRPQLEKIVSEKIFDNDVHSPSNYLTLTFLKHRASFPFALPYTPEGKAYSFVGFKYNVVFSVVDTSVAKTPDLMAWLEKQFTKDITTRTWKTVLRIIQEWDQ